MSAFPARTVDQALLDAAKRESFRGFRFVKEDPKHGATDGELISFAAIEERTRRVAGALASLGLRKGDRVALILPDADDFILTFLAAVRSGLVPVPIYPPTGLGQLAGYLDNTRHIVAKAGATVLITTGQIKALLGTVQASTPSLRQVLAVDALHAIDAPWSPVALSLDDTAFLQFTSGSTSRPKGVVLTHGNLAANIRCIIDLGLGWREDDVGISWLPLFHDMGLIGCVLASMYTAIPVVFVPPLLFLKRPATWLQTVSRHKGTISFGPNFSYALCVKRIKPRELEGVDLSAWRVAGCGAEPIRAETLESFATTFAPWGFRKDAFVPAYGMAESTLAISFNPVGTGLVVDRVDGAQLREGKAAVAPAAQEDDVLRIVGCGPQFPGHQVGVFDLDDTDGARPLPERTVGELRLKGPSVTAGYFEDPETTAATFAGGWLKTGDLGYVADGHVFVCGRIKEVIIVNGRNFYPQDLEWEASQVDGVRKGNVIAFGTRHGGDKEIVVVAFETSATDPAEKTRLSHAIKARIQDTVGLTVDEVVALAAGALPKTSSGKLQRTKTKQLWEEGELLERRSVREQDRVAQVKEIAKSQLGYLKVALFGGEKKK